MSRHGQYERPSSVFGMDSRRLDRILALGLKETGEDASGTPFLSLHSLMEQPGAQIGRYRLLQVLGEGGMGIVYLAEQTEPVRRQVALKIIKPGMDSKRVLTRFETEQQALALMEHPHVAHVYDAGLAPSGRPYFVMEYVNGLPITEYCDQHKLTIEQRLDLFLHVCEAVQHAHQKGIIHRDVKPSNLLVAVQDEEAIPKAIDFGVARAISQPLTEQTLCTEHGQLVGTPEYMSPEQADPGNQDIDTRTDVYSLGVLLHELLVGLLPFDPTTFREGGIDQMRKVIRGQDPAPPSTRLGKISAEQSIPLARRRQTDIRTLRRKLRGDLDWITLKAMEKDRTRRYATVEAMAADIRSFLSHEPVSAAPPGMAYRAAKFIRRHRQMIVAASGAVLLIVVLLGAGRAHLRAAKEHARFEAFEHQRWLQQAQDAYGNGHGEAALAKTETLLASPHVGRKARLLHAQLVLEDQGPGAAVAELEQLLDEPDAVAGQAHFLLANIYYNGDPCAPGGTQEFCERWQRHREKADQLIAGTASYYFLHARAAYGVREMLDMLGQALERDKQHYDSLRERAQVYYSQRDYEKMALDAARMIGIRPDNPQGHELKALALQGLERFDEALHDHDEAIHLAPDEARLYNARRETYMRLGRCQLALGDAQMCAQLQPQDLPYRHNLFAAYTALGRYDEALREYDTFLSYPVLREHTLGGAPVYLRSVFYLYAFKLVAASVAAGCPWHGPGEPPFTAPYGLMYHLQSVYRDARARGNRLVIKGFHPSWSPDGTKLAYSHGLVLASGVAVFDTTTGHTTLLTNSGRNPEWSPDGRYIAFERNRRIWPMDSLAGLKIGTWRPDGWLVTHAGEVWVVDMMTQEVRHVAAGTCPRWGHRSGRLHYTSPQENALYSVSLADRTSQPVEVMTHCGRDPVISPNERYVAEHSCHELKIIDVNSQEVLATWIAPPSPLLGLDVSWSPDSRELSISGSNGSSMGLWIYDLQTGESSKILDGLWMTARWAPDKSKMAVTLGVFLELWQVDLRPGLSTATSFDTVQTREEHCQDLLTELHAWIAADPAFVQAHYIRAYCGLWMGHPQATEWLEELEQALPPYNASNCAREARWMLDATPKLRSKLLPLALLLSRKAVEKEPENADFLMTWGEALCLTGDYENAEAPLLNAYDLTIAGSDTDDLKAIKAAQLLTQLYESWNRPDEAAKWRAKLAAGDIAEE